MLIQELAYDAEADELDLLIDTLQPEPAETLDLGNDIFIRQSVQSKKIVGAVVANYSLWQPDRLPSQQIDPDLTKAQEEIIRYLSTMRHEAIEKRGECAIVKPVKKSLPSSEETQ